jgi:hypothetical protein
MRQRSYGTEHVYCLYARLGYQRKKFLPVEIRATFNREILMASTPGRIFNILFSEFCLQSISMLKMSQHPKLPVVRLVLSDI